MQVDPSDSTQGLVRAFPSALLQPLRRVVLQLPRAEHPTMGTLGLVRVETAGEIASLEIPSRVYFPSDPPCRSAHLTTEQAISACIYSRHHSGWIRQQALRDMLEVRGQWVVPYVLQLLSEYVIEIALEIADHPSWFTEADTLAFAHHNPVFLSRAKQRATSYWNCYFRNRYFRLEDYPPAKVLHQLSNVTSPQMNR
jgi:hypothetical protein